MERRKREKERSIKKKKSIIKDAPVQPAATHGVSPVRPSGGLRMEALAA